MKYSVITGFDDIVGTYVHTRLGSRWIPNMGTAIGLVDDSGSLIAGVTYTNFNGVNVCVDVAAEAPGWCSNKYLYFFFNYPFEQLKCQRMTAQVASSNTRSIQFVEKLGFQYEARLEHAIPGGDIFLYRMFKQECRYLDKPAEFPKVYHNG